MPNLRKAQLNHFEMSRCGFFYMDNLDKLRLIHDKNGWGNLNELFPTKKQFFTLRPSNWPRLDLIWIFYGSC